MDSNLPITGPPPRPAAAKGVASRVSLRGLERTIFDGPFRVEERMAQGGFAAVNKVLFGKSRLIALALFALATGCALDERSPAVTGVGGAAGQADDSRGVGAGGTAQPTVCKGTPVERELITDFSDAFAGTDGKGKSNIQFGAPRSSLGWQSYTYEAPGLTAPTLTLEPKDVGQVLRVTAVPGPPVDQANEWFAFGFGPWSSAGTCLDASAYTGVEFALEGSLGTCSLTLSVQFSQDQRISDNPGAGSCAAPICFEPQSPVITADAAGPIRVPFAALLGGNPISKVDATTITAIGWQLLAPLEGTPCRASLTIAKISFFQ
jgi:hypothetical protein